MAPATSRNEVSVRVAYQGEPGAFSEAAVLRLLPDAEPSLPDVRRRVRRGRDRRGAASASSRSRTRSAACIHRNYDLLVERELPIVGEVQVPVVHHLLALPGVRLDEVRRVLSHPQALAQCERLPARRSSTSRRSPPTTRRAARRWCATSSAATRRRSPRRAPASCSVSAPLRAGIQDYDDNITRFLVIGRQRVRSARPTRRRSCSRCTNEPGALFKALSVFALRDIDLTKLESRPVPGRPWEYLFYLDVAAAREELHVRARDGAPRRIRPVAADAGIVSAAGETRRSGRTRGDRTTCGVADRDAHALKWQSGGITDGPSRAPARAMLQGRRASPTPICRSRSSASPTPGSRSARATTTCAISPSHVKDGIRAAGGTPMEFNTVSISDGITMGTEGMRDVARQPRGDRRLDRAGRARQRVRRRSSCWSAATRRFPARAMALARLERPGLVLYGGSIAPGHVRTARDVTIQDVFEAVGAHAAGRLIATRICASSRTTRARAPAPAAASSPPTRWRPSASSSASRAMGSGSVPATDPGKADGRARRRASCVMDLAAARPPAARHHHARRRSRTRSRRSPRPAARPTPCCT